MHVHGYAAELFVRRVTSQIHVKVPIDQRSARQCESDRLTF